MFCVNSPVQGPPDILVTGQVIIEEGLECKTKAEQTSHNLYITGFNEESDNNISFELKYHLEGAIGELQPNFTEFSSINHCKNTSKI